MLMYYKRRCELRDKYIPAIYRQNSINKIVLDSVCCINSD